MENVWDYEFREFSSTYYRQLEILYDVAVTAWMPPVSGCPWGPSWHENAFCTYWPVTCGFLSKVHLMWSLCVLFIVTMDKVLKNCPIASDLRRHYAHVMSVWCNASGGYMCGDNNTANGCLCHNDVTKWKHFPRYWAICAGDSPVPGEFPTQRPVTRSFDIFFDLRPKKRLSKQWWGWWFETLPFPLWRHGDGDDINASSGYHCDCVNASSDSVRYYPVFRFRVNKGRINEMNITTNNKQLKDLYM